MSWTVEDEGGWLGRGVQRDGLGGVGPEEGQGSLGRLEGRVCFPGA